MCLQSEGSKVSVLIPSQSAVSYLFMNSIHICRHEYINIYKIYLPHQYWHSATGKKFRLSAGN